MCAAWSSSKQRATRQAVASAWACRHWRTAWTSTSAPRAESRFGSKLRTYMSQMLDPFLGQRSRRAELASLPLGTTAQQTFVFVPAHRSGLESCMQNMLARQSHQTRTSSADLEITASWLSLRRATCNVHSSAFICCFHNGSATEDRVISDYVKHLRAGLCRRKCRGQLGRECSDSLVATHAFAMWG